MQFLLQNLFNLKSLSIHINCFYLFMYNFYTFFFYKLFWLFFNESKKRKNYLRLVTGSAGTVTNKQKIFLSTVKYKEKSVTPFDMAPLLQRSWTTWCKVLNDEDFQTFCQWVGEGEILWQGTFCLFGLNSWQFNSGNESKLLSTKLVYT